MPKPSLAVFTGNPHSTRVLTSSIRSCLTLLKTRSISSASARRSGTDSLSAEALGIFPGAFLTVSNLLGRGRGGGVATEGD